MKRTHVLVAMLAVSGFALFENNADAAFRWPWQSNSSAKPKPAATATALPPMATPLTTPIVLQPATPVPAAPQGEEQQFAARIHEVNQKEIAFGNLALARAAEPGVKSYARMLVDDHTKADAMITQRAAALNLTFPPVPSISQDPDYSGLTAKSGVDFDIAFLDAMVRGHDALIPDLARFKEQESDHPFHAELVDLFNTVKHHRAAAKELLDNARQQPHAVKGVEAPPQSKSRPLPPNSKIIKR